ncbi:dienelactone hydrolase family protein [Novosphingobium sp.]|uniref:dienelactone hydrolase family protein n=1 Tax=Novosphingobium sp. TaxID=1874826 RepID=UPI0025D43545|nr:dienelactone hydrolase family protein [Novosphingobium sp.]MCC6924786.1 dienelactone hydrolase family protein [Novosphingobium sp.]
MPEWLKLTMSDGHELPCYHVEPQGERRGGLVLVQEIFGVTEHIRELCEEYAADGYEVISPALFDRIEPGLELGYTGAEWERAVRIARDEQPLDTSLADVQSCIEWIHVRGGPTFIVGYCYGGSLAWRSAQTSDLLDAASCYYGGHVAGRWADEAPKCATITHFGRYDSMVPIEPVEQLIAKQHPTAQHFIYEAGHGFNSDRRKDYHPESAELAKQRTLMLFRALGG